MSKMSEQIRNFFSRDPNTKNPIMNSELYFREEYFGHTIGLKVKGEIRFGPPYFDLLLDNAKISNKTFGRNVWLLDDFLFGAEEWLTISEQDGPLTRLVIFDLKNMKCATFKRIRGFADKARIATKSIVYERRELNSTTEVEIAIDGIDNWSNIFGAKW